MLYICLGTVCILIVGFILISVGSTALNDFEDRRHKHQLECIAMKYALDHYGDDDYISTETVDELRSVIQFVQHNLHE